MKNIALIFPGQGTQTVGMGKELYESSPAAKAVFDQAESIIPGLTNIIFNGPQETLTQTAYCQPAIMTVSVAALAALTEHAIFQTMKPCFAAGHSLGEYSALVACGALSFPNAVRLVQKRAAYMDEASKNAAGAMAAVIGVDKEKLGEICSQTGAQIANYNSLEQIVITGHADKVASAVTALEAAGLGRVVPLAVSGGFHSSLMQPAAEKFAAAVSAVKFVPPAFPLIGNVDALPTVDVATIKANLPKQITSSVLWVSTIQCMVTAGITDCIEVGPGNVLKGLIRKIDSSLRVQNVRTPADVDKIAF